MWIEVVTFLKTVIHKFLSSTVNDAMIKMIRLLSFLKVGGTIAFFRGVTHILTGSGPHKATADPESFSKKLLKISFK